MSQIQYPLTLERIPSCKDCITLLSVWIIKLDDVGSNINHNFVECLLFY